MRARVADLGIAAIPLGLGLFGRGSHGLTWGLPLSVALSVPLYWGRRHPLPVLLAVFAVGLVQVIVALADGVNAITLIGLYDTGIVLAIYRAVSFGKPWTAAFAITGGMAGAAIGAVAWLGPKMSTWNECVGLCALFAPVLLAWATGTAAKTRRAYLASLVERAARLEREQQALAMVAVADERERIARELHDIVAHSVSVMVVQSDGAEAALQQQNLAEVQKAVTAIGRTGRDALAELRLLLGLLRSDYRTAGAAPQPGTDQLKELIESMPVEARLTVSGQPRELPQGLALGTFRIVQEALTNTVKHAGPDASADVRLSYRASGLEVEVTDDGNGTASPGGSGHGLIGMRERVSLFGGTLITGPRPDGGFRVWALLPWM
jgi:signal transduction histidine kinase